MKYFSHINTAAEITGLYKGQQPFHLFIKEFFRQRKKYGSSDRKTITHLCYCYFRLGSSVKDIPLADRMPVALFLCTRQTNEVLAHIKPAWNERVSVSLKEKCTLAGLSPETLNIFPSPAELGAIINKDEFILSHLTQPDVFLRTRPGFRQTVIDKLEKANMSFSLPGETGIALPNTTKIDGLININKEAVVQDYSSQCTGDFLQLVESAGSPIKIWDCCAASGGKSIMAKDILGNIDLTVSDIRESVLSNLAIRFAEAGIQGYKTLVADLSSPVASLIPGSFQLIIADLPCTGSGTWGRTPERLSFFDEKEIDRYSQLQKKIAKTVMPYLKTGGYFLYITCSVFKKENEDITDFILQSFDADLIKMELLQGYKMKADTMFAAIFRKRGGGLF